MTERDFRAESYKIPKVPIQIDHSLLNDMLDAFDEKDKELGSMKGINKMLKDMVNRKDEEIERLTSTMDELSKTHDENVMDLEKERDEWKRLHDNAIDKEMTILDDINKEVSGRFTMEEIKKVGKEVDDICSKYSPIPSREFLIMFEEELKKLRGE